MSISKFKSVASYIRALPKRTKSQLISDISELSKAKKNAFTTEMLKAARQAQK